MFDPEKHYSKLGHTFKPSVLATVVLAAFDLVKQGKKFISMTGGSYDVPSMPVEEIKRIFAEAPREAWADMLQYGSTTGMASLRNELAKFMGESGIDTDPNSEIIVTTGSQEAIDLATRVFIDPGDFIYVGKPTYLQALSAFKTVNPVFREVEIDKEGMNTDHMEKDMEQLKADGKSPKMLYIIPSFQNPTSTVLSMERKKHVLELAEEYDFIIFEDNPYGYISFSGPMPTPIAAMDKTGRVMYTSTFSKIVSPGMRLGWLQGHKDFILKMSEAKGRISIHNDGLAQYVGAEMLRRGDVAKQIPKITNVYRKKRDVMLETMTTSFPKEAEWNDPPGGLFLWVKMPENVNTTALLDECVKRGTAYIPGSNFFAGSVHNYIRLNYSLPSEEDIVDGIQILGKLLSEEI